MDTALDLLRVGVLVGVVLRCGRGVSRTRMNGGARGKASCERQEYYEKGDYFFHGCFGLSELCCLQTFLQLHGTTLRGPRRFFSSAVISSALQRMSDATPKPK